jgi:hypothetical protein
MAFVWWALSMYVIYVVSVVAGDGIIASLCRLWAQNKNFIKINRFSWREYRDQVLKW